MNTPNCYGNYERNNIEREYKCCECYYKNICTEKSIKRGNISQDKLDKVYDILSPALKFRPTGRHEEFGVDCQIAISKAIDIILGKD